MDTVRCTRFIRFILRFGSDIVIFSCSFCTTYFQCSQNVTFPSLFACGRMQEGNYAVQTLEWGTLIAKVYLSFRGLLSYRFYICLRQFFCWHGFAMNSKLCTHSPRWNPCKHIVRGVDKFFTSNSPNWRVVKNVHSPSQKTESPMNGNCQCEGRKPGLAGGFVFFLFSLVEFYSHLASWHPWHSVSSLAQLLKSSDHIMAPNKIKIPRTCNYSMQRIRCGHCCTTTIIRLQHV
jgi:hypothetical protein